MDRKGCWVGSTGTCCRSAAAVQLLLGGLSNLPKEFLSKFGVSRAQTTCPEEARGSRFGKSLRVGPYSCDSCAQGVASEKRSLSAEGKGTKGLPYQFLPPLIDFYTHWIGLHSTVSWCLRISEWLRTKPATFKVLCQTAIFMRKIDWRFD